MAFSMLASLVLHVCVVGVLAGGTHGASCDHVTDEVHGDGELHEDHEHDHEDTDDGYNLGLAIASVFIVGVVSFIGAGYPLLLALKRHPWMVMGIKFGAFAGSGVMLSTGFVHMLFAANESLTSSCMPESWLNRYEPWAFLFCVLTIVVLQTVDYILYLFLYPIQTNKELDVDRQTRRYDETMLPGTGPEGTDMDGMQHGSAGLVMSDDAIDAMETDQSDIVEEEKCNTHVQCKDEECKSRVLLPATPATPKAKLMSNLLVSEISIGVHSIIIGLALGMTSSSEFVALFVAIIFHQLLEGVALGSNAAESGAGFRIQLLFALIYAISTPIGIAIGIGVRQSLDTSSTSYLYTTGVLDAVAAGALIFLALGDHMNAVRSQAPWLRIQKPIIQTICFLCFFTGAAVMLVLAIWA